MKYVLVSGGVISGIGKGIIASSTGLLLKTLGLKVTAIKIDPYLNIDAGKSLVARLYFEKHIKRDHCVHIFAFCLCRPTRKSRAFFSLIDKDQLT